MNFANKITSRANCPQGTKIIISDAYYNLPARQTYLHSKNVETINDVMELLKEYSLIFVEIKFILTHSSGGKTDCYFDSGAGKIFSQPSWRLRIETVLGSKIAESLVYFDNVVCEGWTTGRILSGSERPEEWLKKKVTYMYLNRRPLNFIRSFSSVLEEVYKEYNSSSKYVCLVRLKLKEAEFDINVSPDKRTIYWRNEVEAVGFFKKSLKEITEKSRNEIKNLSTFVSKKSVSKRQSSIQSSQEEKETAIFQPKPSEAIKQRLSHLMSSRTG